MRKFINILLLLIDWGITSLIIAIFYFGIFYLVPGKSASDQILTNIWLWFFVPFLLLLTLLITKKKTRNILFSKTTTIISGVILLIYFSLYYASVAINTYQAYFQSDTSKPHDYADIPVFATLTIEIILISMYLILRKFKKNIKEKTNRQIILRC